MAIGASAEIIDDVGRDEDVRRSTMLSILFSMTVDKFIVYDATHKLFIGC